MYNYISNFFSGGVDPFWPHLALIMGSVVGGALVGLGVILEAKKLISAPTAAVVVGVVIEAACTILLFGFDEGISQSQQRTITQLTAPRRLAPEQKSRIATAIKAFPSETFFTVTVPDAEAWDFAMDIATTLKGDGWIWAPCQGGLQPLDGRPASCMSILDHVQINVPPGLEQIGNALGDAIRTPSTIGLDRLEVVSDKRNTAIVIMVGTKR